MPARIIDNEIYLYGAVGSTGPEEEGFTSADVIQALSSIGFANDVRVHINSFGGDAFEGLAINAAFRNHRGEVTVIVEAIAASAASVAAMGADVVIMTEGSFFMIHDPAAMTFGNAADHSKTGASLNKLAGSYADQYSERTGQSPQAMRDMMVVETWMTAAEAVEHGFADAIETFASAENDNDELLPAAFAYAAYARAPARFVALAQERGWAATANTQPIEENKMAKANTSGRKRTPTASARIKAALEENEKHVEALKALLASLEGEKDEADQDDSDKDEPEVTASADDDKADDAATETEKSDEDDKVTAEMGEGEKKEEDEAPVAEVSDEDAKKKLEEEEAEKARAEGITKVVAAASRINPSVIAPEDAKDFIDAKFTVAQASSAVHAKLVANQTQAITNQNSNTGGSTISASWKAAAAKINARLK